MFKVRGRRGRAGFDRHHPRKAPAHEIIVDDFAIDAVPVTDAVFGAFIGDMGCVTMAEPARDPALYTGVPDVRMARRRALPAGGTGNTVLEASP